MRETSAAATRSPWLLLVCGVPGVAEIEGYPERIATGLRLVAQMNYKTRAEWEGALDWGDHHLGTTRMHVDPKQGVVDANSRVHGIANLFVAGSGVFPTYSASNPTLNLVALTLRLGQHLKTGLR